jgi:hypothetical protein
MSNLKVFGKHGNTYTGVYSCGDIPKGEPKRYSDEESGEPQLYAWVPREQVQKEILRRLDILDDVLAVCSTDINNLVGPLKKYDSLKDANTFESWYDVLKSRRELDRDKWHQFLKPNTENPDRATPAALYATGWDPAHRQIFPDKLGSLGPKGPQVKALLDFQNDIQKELAAGRGVPGQARIVLPVVRTTGDRFGRYQTFIALVQVKYFNSSRQVNNRPGTAADAWLTVQRYDLNDDYIKPDGKYYKLLEDYLKNTIEDRLSTQVPNYQRELFF